MRHWRRGARAIRTIGLLLAIAFVSAACQPTVKVQAPDKPIEINMNIHIQQEVRVRVENDLESAFAQNPDLFGVPAETDKPASAQSRTGR